MGLLFMAFGLSAFVLGTILMIYEAMVISIMEPILDIKIIRFDSKVRDYTY